MEWSELWKTVAAVVGAGGLAGVVGAAGSYMLSRRRLDGAVLGNLARHCLDVVALGIGLNQTRLFRSVVVAILVTDEHSRATRCNNNQ